MKPANGSVLEKAQEKTESLRKEIKTFSINVPAFLCKKSYSKVKFVLINVDANFS